MTIDLAGRTIYTDGTVICSQAAMIEILYSGGDLSGIMCNDPDDEQEWQSAAKACDSSALGPKFESGAVYNDIDWYQHWLTPEPYASIDLEEWCYAQCTTDQQRDRVKLELTEMQSRNMYPIIRHVIYCADVWRKNGIVWGVGRGSSVCSFVLYLTGINRINPLEYGLDLKEWLK